MPRLAKRETKLSRFLGLYGIGKVPKRGTEQYDRFNKDFQDFKSGKMDFLENVIRRERERNKSLEEKVKRQEGEIKRYERRSRKEQNIIDKLKGKKKRMGRIQRFLGDEEKEEKGELKSYQLNVMETGLGGKDTNENPKVIPPHVTFVNFKAKNDREAIKLADELVNYKGPHPDNPNYEVLSRERISLKREEEKKMVNIKFSPMKEVGKITKYEIYNCDPNYSEKGNCVLNYLEERLGRCGKNIPGKLMKREFLNGYFVELQKIISSMNPNPINMNDIPEEEDFVVDERNIDLSAKEVDGITPQQLQYFCKQYDFSHHCITAVGTSIYRYISSKTYKPSIIYVTDGKHLYPIKDHHEKRKIIERYKTEKRKEERERKEVEIKEYDVVETLDEALALKGNKLTFILKEENLLDYVIKLMKEKNVVFDRSCYKFDSDGVMIRFKNLWVNPEVRECLEICKALNIPFVGQSLSRVASELIKELGFSIGSSALNRDLFNRFILTSRGGVSQVFNNCENKENVSGFDTVKCYSSILYEEKKLPIFDAFCEASFMTEGEDFENYNLYEVEWIYDYNILLRGKGLYYGFTLKKCREKNYNFSLSGKKWTPSSFIYGLDELVLAVYDKIGEKWGKVIINTFTGTLGKNINKKVNVYLDSSLEMASLKVASRPDSVIYKEDENIFKVVHDGKEDVVLNNMPANLFIIQKARVKLLELAEGVMGGGRLLRTIVDCVIVENGDESKLIRKDGFYALQKKTLQNPYHFGCFKKLGKEEAISKIGKKTQKVSERLVGRQLRPAVLKWNEVEIVDEYDTLTIANNIIELGGAYICGIAGTGKSYVLKKVIELLGSEKKHIMAFTNTASVLISGKTLHRSFGLSAFDSVDNAKTFGFSKGDWVVVDEISLIPSNFWKLFLKLKERGCKFVLCGDLNQLPAVERVIRNITKDSQTIKDIAGNLVELKINKRSDDKVFSRSKRILAGEEGIQNEFTWTTEKPSEKEYHITLKNETRNAICKHLERKLYKGKEWILIEGYKIKGKDGKYKRFPSMRIWRGYPVECYKSSRSIGVVNGFEYTVCDWDENNIWICPEDDIENNICIERDVFKYYIRSNLASTCHRAQGKTINVPIRIWDSDHFYASSRWLYTAITRTTKFENIRFSSYDDVFGIKVKNELFEWLSTFGTVEREKKFEWTLNKETGEYFRYDYYIPEKNLIVELDGPQHFREVYENLSLKQVQERDEKKQKLALEHGLCVMRFKWEDFKNGKIDKEWIEKELENV